MEMSVILDGEKLKQFCNELNIKHDVPKIIIKIIDNKAKYYDFENDCFKKIDIEIAKKYI